VAINDFNPAYIGQRDDIIALVPSEVSKVLDIGCSVGALGSQLKNRSNAEVVGIELNKEMAGFAEKVLDKVIIGDVEEIKLINHFSSKDFDCVIFADILEHLRDPWEVLKNIKEILSDKGLIIASIPNVRHYSTITSLLFKGYWPYRERGIHDKTHLRFFTLKNIRELFGDCGYRIKIVHRKYRIIEKPHRYNQYSKYFAFPIIRDFLTFQYVIVARKI